MASRPHFTRILHADPGAPLGDALRTLTVMSGTVGTAEVFALGYRDGFGLTFLWSLPGGPGRSALTAYAREADVYAILEWVDRVRALAEEQGFPAVPA